MNDDLELWRRIHSAFEGHRGVNDHNAQAALERIAMKCLGLQAHRQFNSMNCSVKETSLNRSDLETIRVYHRRADPKRHDPTIVLIRFNGDLYAVDGNNRVNHWRQANAPGPFSAVIIEPTDS